MSRGDQSTVCIDSLLTLDVRLLGTEGNTVYLPELKLLGRERKEHCVYLPET